MRQGGLRDAILHSAGANAAHGLRRTNADKRRAVSILLQDELVAVDPATGDPWSDREVARRCSVHHELVGRMRADLTGVSASEPTTRAHRDRHGNVSAMNTGRIGRSLADPREEQDVQPEPSPAQNPDNVIQLGNRLNVIPSPEMIESGLIAEEVASDPQPDQLPSDRQGVGHQPIDQSMPLRLTQNDAGRSTCIGRA